MESFIAWARVNGEKFSGMSPEDLVEYGLDANQREMNELLDLKKRYLLTMKGRLNHKKNANKAIQSFYSYNRVQLPKDSTLNLRGDAPKVEATLTAEHLKQIIMASNPAFQAAFLVMLGGGMGQDEFIQWSDAGYTDLKKQLSGDCTLVKIQLHGRKSDKNEYNYSTFIGGDALSSLKKYLRIRGDQPGAVFLNNHHKAATQDALYTYFSRKVERLGIEPEVEATTDGQRWTGFSPHSIRDVFRTLWRRSGVPVEYAEHFMGHRNAFDKYGYDRTAQDEEDLRSKYLMALPHLNIISDTKAFKLVKQDEVTALTSRIKDLETQLSEAEAGRVRVLEELERRRRESDATNAALLVRLEKIEKVLAGEKS